MFINSTGQIIRIKKGTKPRTWNIIAANKQTRGILQVNEGFVEKFGIQVGDSIDNFPLEKIINIVNQKSLLRSD